MIRRGRVVGEADRRLTRLISSASLMVGRQVSLTQDKTHVTPGEIALEVSDLQVIDEGWMLGIFDCVSFEVHLGEVAIAGNRAD